MFKENAMLQTIEVEIDASGHIHPLEPLTFTPSGRAYLTLLPPVASKHHAEAPMASALQALELLATPRFASRPIADSDEVLRRIHGLRNEWGEQ
jgi:hypothetical protein